MAEFIPPLGTADPQIFMENVRRLDQLMLSSELTFPDRAGELLYTWRGIHQTLIPLSKQYMTLAAAQADICARSVQERRACELHFLKSVPLAAHA